MTTCELEIDRRPLTMCDIVDIINSPTAWED